MSQKSGTMTQESQREFVRGKWWIFFPLRGLDLIDKHPTLKKPLFGDATLLSKSHVKEVVHEAKINEKGSPGHDHEKDITMLIESKALNEEYQSLVAVRRTGKLSSGLREPSKIFYHAYSRASEISATLALIFLSRNKRGLTCGLVEQIYHKMQPFSALDITQAQFIISSSWGRNFSHTILDPKQSIQFSASQIQDILDSQEFGSFASILLMRNSTCGKSTRRALSASASRLAEAIHSPNRATRLLGAVTAIEILLSESGDTYDAIIRRLVTLLGKPILEQFRVKELLHSRHLYVHKGEEPQISSNIDLNAIGLALNTIFKYSHLALQFSTKQAIIDYLELIDKAHHIREDLGSLVLNDILRHIPTYQIYPFLQSEPSTSTSVSG